ncbi:hypothetical protein HW555_006627, partial [Spodoptera exigua]
VTHCFSFVTVKKMSSQRRKAFTIEEKGAIICRLENGESNSCLAKEFGVGHSTISMIFKNKNRIKQSFNSNVLKPKRLRKSRQENVDQALIQWFINMRNKGIPVSGPMLQEKANGFAARFGILDFNCSASWISRFKVRHNIVAGKIVDAILMVNDAWNKMSQSTIHNCFKHAGFIESHDGLPIQISEHEFDEEDDIPLSLWSRNLNSDSLAAPEMWEEYVDIDSALLTFEEPTDENIVQNISAKEQLESDGEEEVEEAPLPTAEEALKAAELLSRFVHSNIENDNLTIAMSSIHNSIRVCFYNKMKKQKQTKITDYLQ